jgi:hypothetical protein
MAVKAALASVVVCLLMPLSVVAGEREDHAFEQLKSLAGTWDTVTPDGDGTITYRVASAGSVVIEELFPGTDHEMMTVYHRDGDALVATHYCSAGNQPRFALDRTAPEAEGLRFTFTGGSNMAPGDGHIHEGTIRIVDRDHVEAEWSFWKDNKPQHVTTFSMTRRAFE